MNKNNSFIYAVAFVLSFAMAGASITPILAVNPFLPLWEYIPDGEPYIFEDPDNPGKYRIYIWFS